jgi:hypothetical protein
MDPLPHPPHPTQLPLPLARPDAAIPSPPPLAEVVIRPRTLWRRLTPDLRAQARRTLVQICQGVLDDPA